MLTEKQIRRAPKKDYMNEAQLEFFKNHLLELKRETISHIDEARQRLADANRETDELDRALTEEENRLRLRIADRESKLLPKIDEALKRIEEGNTVGARRRGSPSVLSASFFVPRRPSAPKPRLGRSAWSVITGTAEPPGCGPRGSGVFSCLSLWQSARFLRIVTL